MLYRHKHTFQTLDQMAEDTRPVMQYQKTYDFAGPFVSSTHLRLALAPTFGTPEKINIGIEGALMPAEALKLYELSYFCGGDVLQLGVHKGLPTSIIAEASKDSGRGFAIVAVDVNAAAIETVGDEMRRRDTPGADSIHYFVFDAATFVGNMAGAERRFELVYVDHSREYAEVFATCQCLREVVRHGYFALFAGYNDPRNADPNAAHGVYQAVHDGLSENSFEFWGTYGSAGLFRRLGPRRGG